MHFVNSVNQNQERTEVMLVWELQTTALPTDYRLPQQAGMGDNMPCHPTTRRSRHEHQPFELCSYRTGPFYIVLELPVP